MGLSSLLLVLAFLGVLGTVVAVHELGHFILARAVGVRIQEFGIGLPPRLAKLGNWRGTDITLNWIPLGGFVKPVGEFDPDQEGGLAAARPLARLGVLWAGCTANLLLSLVLLTVAFMSGWPDQVQVLYVSPGSPAEAAGLVEGDRILTANGERVRSAEELSSMIAEAPGKPVGLGVNRSSQQIDLQLVPRTNPPEGEGPAGFTSKGVIVQYGVGGALGRAVEEMANLLRSTARLSVSAIRGDGSSQPVRLSSPVALMQASTVAMSNAINWQRAFPVLFIGAWLSFAVAITNLLPLPALDGGRAAFVIVEMIRGRRVDPKRERLVHAAGMVVLLALLVVLTVRDVVDPLL